MSLKDKLQLKPSLNVPGPATYQWTNPQSTIIAQDLERPNVTIAIASQADAGVYTCTARFKPVSDLPALWATTTTFTVGEFLETFKMALVCLSATPLVPADR